VPHSAFPKYPNVQNGNLAIWIFNTVATQVVVAVCIHTMPNTYTATPTARKKIAANPHEHFIEKIYKMSAPYLPLFFCLSPHTLKSITPYHSVTQGIYIINNIAIFVPLNF